MFLFFQKFEAQNVLILFLRDEPLFFWRGGVWEIWKKKLFAEFETPK